MCINFFNCKIEDTTIIDNLIVPFHYHCRHRSTTILCHSYGTDHYIDRWMIDGHRDAYRL